MALQDLCYFTLSERQVQAEKSSSGHIPMVKDVFMVAIIDLFIVHASTRHLSVIHPNIKNIWATIRRVVSIHIDEPETLASFLGSR